MDDKLHEIIIGIQPLVDAIAHHKLFGAITSIARLRRFTEIHVYAVWDFICLLKALQRKLTSQHLLWSPPVNPLGCYLVNTLVAEEESDCIENNHYLSHFELYLEAMRQCGADTSGIRQFIASIYPEQSLISLLATNNLPKPAQRFIQDTFEIIEKESHAIAASLAFAREQITSNMFTRLLNTIESPKDPSCSLHLFKVYLQRHIELDSSQHSQQSQRLVATLCGSDKCKWDEVLEAAWFSLHSRLQLLDGIYYQVMEI